MKSDMPLDYALFQLSPKHSRCELVVSSGRNVEKLASGSMKPFATHLRVVEEQVGASVHSIKLEVERRKNAEMWFTKGTLERFVRFVSTPEVLELANTFDAEVAQLESARRIYSQGQGDQQSGAGGAGSSATAAADATKKELLRAIDVRLAAAQQDLTTACGRAAAAGFNPSTVTDLQMFSDHFGAQRLYEACSKFVSLCERRPDLISSWKTGGEDWSAIRASYGSDMSIDEDPQTPRENQPTRFFDPSLGQKQLQDFKPRFTSEEAKTSFLSSLSRESSVEPEEIAKQNEKQEDSSDQTPSIQASQPSRRLSVQDRVKLFENKQKESSGNSGSGGVKPVVGKSIEFRRLSSDMSSLASAAAVEKAEKAVLRRWSGISDMSIDFSCEKRDPESPSSVSVSKSEDQRDTASSSKEEVDMGRLAISSEKSEEAFVKNRPSSASTATDGDGVKDEVREKSQHKSVSNWGEDESLNVQANSERKSSSSMSEDGSSGENQPIFKVFESRDEPMHVAGLQDKDVSQLHSGPFPGKGAVYASQPDQVELSSQKVEVGFKDKHSSETLLRIPNRSMLDGGSGSRNRATFTSRYGGAEGDTPSSKSRVETKDIGKKELSSGSQKTKIEKQVRSIGNSSFGKTSFSSRSSTDKQDDFGSFATPPPEHAQKSRQTKGNQELNDELKLKANELEKLFAEHKLRVPGEQSNPTRRSKPVDRKNEPLSNSLYKKPSADMTVPFNDDSLFMVPDGAGSSKEMSKLDDAGDVPDWNSPELNASGGSRGKYYQSYMQKRDAKLKEEWSSKKEEKEAKLREMQDSLERSRAEMTARFSGSSERQDSLSKTRQRAERLRSFNSRSILRREQQQLDFEQSDEEEEDGTEFPEQKYFAEDGPLNGTSSIDVSSKIPQTKKTVPAKSFTPRTSAAPIKSASRAANIPGRRKMQSDNHLAQSVPNFSDLRKENAKPSSAASKATRPQVRNYNRSKSTAEESPFAKEEKPRRMPPVRKSSAFKEASTLNSEVASLKTAEFDKDDVEQSSYDLRSKPLDKKPFRKKGSLDFGARATESSNNEFEYDDSVFEAENSMVVVQDEEDEFETHAIIANGEPEADNKSEKVNFGSEYVVVRSSSLVAEMPALAPSGNVHDSPGESPVSWNSRSLYPFNYTHELSDIDASVDSPIGSPASWNSHSLSQTENDAARMRKKWGAAQKPMLVGNSSHKQSHKDVTSGFKRLLKFGRKSRGTESLVDWISATTSEGDDDTEDGRDPSNRSSDDLRKSRMGSLQGHPSDDSFNDGEFFNEQVHSLRSSIPAPPANFKLREDHLSGSSIKAPRSFFSLSSFRSKGSESKPR